MHVTIADAEVAIEAARERALELGTEMCIAIVDSGANLKAFHRMDDAWVGSIDIAIKKAKTAVFFGMPTGLIGKLSPAARCSASNIQTMDLLHFPAVCPSSTRRASWLAPSASAAAPSRMITRSRSPELDRSASAICRSIRGAHERCGASGPAAQAASSVDILTWIAGLPAASIGHL